MMLVDVSIWMSSSHCLLTIHLLSNVYHCVLYCYNLIVCCTLSSQALLPPSTRVGLDTLSRAFSCKQSVHSFELRSLTSCKNSTFFQFQSLSIKKKRILNLCESSVRSPLGSVMISKCRYKAYVFSVLK